MNATLLKQIEDLRSAPIAEVRDKYVEVFGEEPRSRHKESLIRRIGWRMQALTEGGLSERARKRALAIAAEGDIRVLPPRGHDWNQSSRLDRRIPTPGTVLRRKYRSQTIEVKVLAAGFEYKDRQYSSLSAIATEVTGTRWNGLAFFGLAGRSGSGRGRHAASKG